MLLDGNDLDSLITERILYSNFFTRNIYKLSSSDKAIKLLEKLDKEESVKSGKFPEVVFADMFTLIRDKFDFINYYASYISKANRKPILIVISTSHCLECLSKIKALTTSYVFLKKPIIYERLLELNELA